MPTSQTEKANRFRALHAGPGAFVIANAWDAGSARILAGVGFAALATSSGAAAGTLGRRDGLITRDEALAHCARHRRGDRPAGLGRPGEGLRRRAGRRRGDDPPGRRGRPGRRLDRGRDRRSANGRSTMSAWRPSASRRRWRRRGRCRSLHADGARGELPARQPRSRRRDPRLQAFEKAGADVLMAPGLPDLAAVRTVCSALSKPFNFMVGIKGKSFSVAELRRLACSGSASPRRSIAPR